MNWAEQKAALSVGKRAAPLADWMAEQMAASKAGMRVGMRAAWLVD